MKNYFKIILLLCSFSVFGFVPKKPIKKVCKTISKTTFDPKKENKILEIVFNALKSKHLLEKKIDDNFSKKVYKTYLDSLDRNKLFLLQSDVDEFKKYETKLDDQIKNNDLSFFFMTYDRLIMRMREGKEMYTNLLKNEYEFEKSGNAVGFYSKNPDISKKLTYKKNQNEQKKYWLDFIKFSVFYDSKDEYKKIISNEDFLEFQKLIYKNLGNTLESKLTNYVNVNRETILEYFINAIVIQFDLHSSYYNTYTRDKYLIKQSGKLEGAGITIRQGLDYVEIKSLMVGGPADKTKKFEKGDVILKIGQENEDPENVVGYKIYDVVKLLKGKSGTIVKVTIKKPDGSIEVVSVKRAVVSTNDSNIKSCLVNKNKVKFGLISFPRFYIDFDDDMSRNSVDDFEDELQILKESEVQGVILDLRDNQGGSVEAAVKILGNFIENNPVIQLKNKEQIISTLNIQTTKPVWDKSIVLIVNSETASAAEIFASAFKQYNVGVVIGEKTYGKGTVQDFLDLNTFISKKTEGVDYGALKLTTTKFYETNGIAIQKTSVVPNIVFYEDKNLRESNLLGALSPDNVNPLQINPNSNNNQFNKIIERSKNRLLDNEKIKLAIKNEQFFMKVKSDFDKIAALNPETLKKQLDDILLQNDILIKNNYKNDLVFYSNISDIKLMKSKPYLVQKRKDWLTSLNNDFQIEEGLNILEDMYILKN